MKTQTLLLTLWTGLALSGATFDSAGGTLATPPKLAPKPDLVCAIAVSRNEDGTSPIGNGEVTNFAKGATVYLHVSGTNQGNAAARDFKLEGIMFRGTTLFGSLSQDQALLLPRGVMKYKVLPLELFSENALSVQVEMDKKNTVNERDEANNKCQFSFTPKFAVRAVPLPKVPK